MPSTPGRPTGRVLLVGLVLFALGVLAVLADVVPFFFGDDHEPLWLYLACLLVPVGLVITVWSGIARGRREQRRALRDVEALRR